ncbi:methyl-accepting chemotaxis protein TlpB [Sporomusaceae bacterium FL31]|nr:methyl-accepting chemotaxis protein TlpB [Sporomusaceae bacterium FL31]GCE34424.1 methyl-accepting chemotaxis protein TlpB [Sporomusaceae bacterium]
MLKTSKTRFTIGVQILMISMLIILSFSALIGYQKVKSDEVQQGYENLVKRSAPLVFDVKELIIELKNQGYLARGYLLTGNAAYLQQYDESLKKTENVMQSLEKNLITPEGKQKVAETKVVLKNYQQVTQKTLEIYKQKGQQEALSYLATAGDANRNAEASLSSLSVFLTERMDLRVKQSQEADAVTERIMLMAALIVVLLAVTLSIWFSRRIARPLREVVTVASSIAAGNLVVSKIAYNQKDEIQELVAAFEQMAANLRNLISQVGQASEHVAVSSAELREGAEQSAQAINQVASTVSDISQGTQLQVAAVDGTVAIVEQMSAGIQQVAANSSSVAGVSDKANHAAANGRKSLEQAVEQIQSIETTVAYSAQVVAKLGDRSKEIGQIVDTISSIAGQTNLLALNAAIEAARAGEHGRGFSVVAEEVRKLAEQSEDAAKKIANMISEVQVDTTEAVTAMNKGTHEVKVGTEVVNRAGSAFAEIEALISQVSLQMGDIAAAIQQMAAGSHEIVASVKEIERISKDTADQTHTVSAAGEEQSASIEEIAASSQALSKMAGDLQAMLRKFTI